MRRDERGQAAALIIGLTVVAVMLVAVVVDASAAYLRRSGLDSVADGAALAAADGIAGSQVYEGGLDERADLDPALARRYVAEYVAATSAARRYPGLRYEVDTGPERVVVRVAAPLDLPIAPSGWTQEARISSTAAAVVVVGP